MWIDYRSEFPLDFSRSRFTAPPQKCVINLSQAEGEALASLDFECRLNPYLATEREAFVEFARHRGANALNFETTRRIREELLSGFGVVLVRGMPIGSLPSTPRHGGNLPADCKANFLPELDILTVGLVAGGEPFNFRQEGLGTAPLIDNIVPMKELREQKGAGGYSNNFPFHCESAWHRMKPDFLALLAARGDCGAKTIVFSAAQMNAAEWPLTELLDETRFRIRAPDLYLQMEGLGIPLGTNGGVVAPPIERVGNSVLLNINFNGVECADSEACRWLRRLEEYIEDSAIGFTLSSGDALLLNNSITCHTRTGYKPGFNGADRWLLRTYFKNDLWNPKRGHDRRHPLNVEAKQLEKLRQVGWTDCKGELTKDFGRYLENPKEMTALGNAQSELAKIACQMTPIDGMRLV